MINRRVLWRVVPLAILVASCDGSPSGDNGPVVAATVDQRTPITMRSMEGEPDQVLYLVEPKRQVPLSELAAGLRDSGSRCEAMKSFKQLEQNGERLDVYKADCLNESYQVTLINGNSHIKPWTGNLMGS